MEDSKYDIDPSIVNRRGIYKDVYGSGPGREWSDYRLRPNFLIAMVVAPELFDEHHALYALQLADRVLRGPLGMKSLDPADMQYRPIFDDLIDSDDPWIAKGMNYHNVGISVGASHCIAYFFPGTRVGMATWIFPPRIFVLRYTCG